MKVKTTDDMILYHDDLLFIIIIVPTVPWRGFQSRQPFALRFTPILTPLLVPTQTLGEHAFLHRKTPDHMVYSDSGLSCCEATVLTAGSPCGILYSDNPILDFCHTDLIRIRYET